LGGFDPQPDREVSLPGPRWAEQHHVLGLGQERSGAQVSDGVALETGLVIEDEVLDRLGGTEPRGPGPQLRP